MQADALDTAAPAPETIRPIRDQVLIRQDPPVERLASGLYLPDSAARALLPDTGTVIAVGPGLVDRRGVLVPLAVQTGDRVMFKRKPDSALMPDPRTAVAEGIPDSRRNLLMLTEDFIVGVLEAE